MPCLLAKLLAKRFPMATAAEIERLMADPSAPTAPDPRALVETLLSREAKEEDGVLKAERLVIAHSNPKGCLEILIRQNAAMLAETQRLTRLQKEWEAMAIIAAAAVRGKELRARQRRSRKPTVSERILLGRKMGLSRAMLQSRLRWIEGERALLRDEANEVFSKSESVDKAKWTQLQRRLSKSHDKAEESDLLIGGQMGMQIWHEKSKN